METLPNDWLSFLILTFVLGMKHGFDADHLATIDGLTRYNGRYRPGLARYCGALFSLGHGLVVMAIAVGVAVLAGQWIVPTWFETLGLMISIVFLVSLGWINLAAVLRARSDQLVVPVGLKGRLVGRLGQASHPALIALVGALFAVSFDTLSQAAFFALTANRFGGWEHAVLLATLFMLGMLATDSLNGLWIARLISRADELALIASRIMGLAISGISLLVAAFGVAKFVSPVVDAWSEGKELVFGACLLLVIAISFWGAVWLARRPVST